MAVIVDPPLFVALFKESDERHNEFTELLKWVVDGPAKFIIGGTKYKKELSSVGSVLPLIMELSRARKIFYADDVAVDNEEKRVKIIEPANDFDDPHLVALVSVSKAKIICIVDPRAHKFLRRSDLYANSSMRPKLFTRAKNKNLLKKDNLKGICYI